MLSKDSKRLLWEILLFSYCLNWTSTHQYSHDHLSQILLFRILHFSDTRVILLTFVNVVLLGVDSVLGILITFMGEQYTSINKKFLVTEQCKL